ncbi:hypothetical protein [Edaphobacter modestus]|uniref:Uncharacterized protein n=1 Tax=Edaphobacter modestus TaxID=388466 RepID=A0A4Q7YXG0_9BACT|nr:hypothetical protein [Edaphobacter modestus]RZU42418.1 hypothetical protein BDD14_4002 [Edaphobacter modestus]
MRILGIKGLLAFAPMLLATQQLAFAQTPISSPAFACKEIHRTLAPKNPRMAADGSIIPGQAIVQESLTLSEGATVKIVEYPRSGKDLDSYNSTIIVQRGQEQKSYPVERLIKYGSVLRLVEVASLCTSSDQGLFFLAFEAGSSGASEGFVVVRYSTTTVDVQAFPMANQGRIVIKRAAPNEVELWSANADSTECDACKKHYSVQNCHVEQQSIECKLQPGAGETLSPNKLMNARIVIR